MRKITGIAVLAVVTVATAAALDVGVGAFYAPGKVFGEASEIDRFSPGGFKGRVSLGVYEGLNLAFGVGYNDFAYREVLISFPEVDFVNSIPTLTSTLGADYALRLGPLRPFVGGGAAIAREAVVAYRHETTDWFGGLYAEAGARYFLVNGLAMEAGPRYTRLFDAPVVCYDDINAHDFVRSESPTQLFELLVGVNYYF